MSYNIRLVRIKMYIIGFGWRGQVFYAIICESFVYYHEEAVMNVLDKDILMVLSEYPIKDQEELKIKLGEMGFSITQASLSRRLKKMGVQKVDGIYQVTDQRSARRLSDTVIQVSVAPPNLILLRTLPGCANYAADFLDEMIELPDKLDPTGQYRGMIGTIAGDDTIMVVINDPLRLEPIAAVLQDHIG